MKFLQKVQFFFLYSLFFLQMSFHQMIWLKSSSLFLCLGPAVYVCTGPRLSLKIPGKLKTCCQSAFNAPRDNLECLHMPRRACGVGKVWHRQVLWLMHCLVCPWADSELKAWWEPYLHFFFLLLAALHMGNVCINWRNSSAYFGINRYSEENRLYLLTVWESQFKYTLEYNFAVQKFHHFIDDGNISFWIIWFLEV